MLAIRMQRTGRSGHAQFRVIVQDARAHPKSGRVTAYLGNYDPHAKTAQLDSEKIAAYLANGAQPSDRVAKLLKKEGIKLPAWVNIAPDKKRAVRSPEKLRRNAPPGEKTAQPAPEAATEAPASGQPAAEAPEPAEPAGQEKAQTPAADEASPADTPAETAAEPPAETAAAETAPAKQANDQPKSA